MDQGLTEELYKFPKIEDTEQEIEFQLFVETYQLVEPLIKERDVNMQEQTIFIGNIPLMNSLETSIVNGIYRIVINQILQSPGIYYRSELDHNEILVYTGTEDTLDWNHGEYCLVISTNLKPHDYRSSSSVGILLVHKNKHQINQRYQEKNYMDKNHFYEFIARHQKMTENKDQNHYDLFVPENISSPNHRP
ncbi:hypothetical protein CXB51_031619 [Gossypium anomalum]|uniref:Uncharacterized protein n=1 Tax=Gossypium anomalum TaxID=47600 RepID=A0A8J6CL69_9ROSI|nr:hypothetical protein CXB51_031619 [Gossypium anomalum]